MTKIVPIIVSGGQGTRLFPLSTTECPKQFVPNLFDSTLFEKSLDLVSNSSLFENPIIVSNIEYAEKIKSLLIKSKRDMSSIDVILEDVGKNTLPAIFYGLRLAEELYSIGSKCLILFSDHLILEKSKFEDACILAFSKNSISNNPILFGKKPSYPSTSYGYFETDNLIISSFKEKPSIDLASDYCKQPNYFWNTGITLMSYYNLLSNIDVDYAALLEANFYAAFDSEDEYYIVSNCDEVVSESISRAIFEKANNLEYIELESDWIDVGNFNSLYSSLPKDSLTKVATLGNVLYKDCKDSLIISKSKQIQVIGLDNVVVIETENGILVLNKSVSESYKSLS